MSNANSFAHNTKQTSKPQDCSQYQYTNSYHECCVELEHNSVLRDLQAIYCPDHINHSSHLGSGEMLDFSSNDYLGLSQHPKVVQAATQALHKYGAGATGSRLLSGNIEIFSEFEKEIAADKGTEASLIFNTGFQANCSVLASLLSPKVLKAKPIVLFDRYNHSSLYQAVFLSGAKLMRYQHNDAEHLRSILHSISGGLSGRPIFIVTETVFGMDGDVLNRDIIEVAKQFGAFVYLDEAHATGVMGKNGYGLASEYDLDPNNSVVMGTFSKAVGVFGAYIACNKKIKQYLINKCPGFVYSTALPPATIAAARSAWGMIGDMQEQRRCIMENSRLLYAKLRSMGLSVEKHSSDERHDSKPDSKHESQYDSKPDSKQDPKHESQYDSKPDSQCDSKQDSKLYSNIIPIVLKDNQYVKNVKKDLLKHNINVSAILPPTVPAQAARLRIAVCAKHTGDDIKHLVNTLQQVL